MTEKKKKAAPKKEKVPPQNLVAEKAVLGGLIRSEDTFWQIDGLLRADMFSETLHQQIYTTIRDICLAGQRLSLTLLASRLPPMNEEGVPIEATLAVLLKNADDLGTPLDFAEDVAETASRRRLIAVGEALVKDGYGTKKPALDAASEAELAILDVMNVSSPQKPQLLSDLANQVMRTAAKTKETDILPGFLTGLNPVDAILGLILAGDLGFIIGSQGDGKTALATQIGAHVAESRPVLMIQGEMTAEQIAARELAAASGVPVNIIQEGAFDFAQHEQMILAEQKLAKPALWIIDVEEITVRQIRAVSLALMRQLGSLGLLIVDQLDKIKGRGFHRDRFEKSMEVTRDLKNFAKATKVPTICLAQRTRSAQRREDATPDILDTDAPSIERDADWVLAVWRLENWLRKNRPAKGKNSEEEMSKWQMELHNSQGFAEVICLKHRRRKAFEQRRLIWKGELTRFQETNS